MSWIDDRVGIDAQVVFVNNISLADNPHTLWQTEFWNRSIETIVNLVEPPHIILGRPGAIDPVTGRIVTSDAFAEGPVRTAPYAVAPAALELAGDVIAKPGNLLVLYRVDRPLRLARAQTGLYADGWTTGDMTLSQYVTPGQQAGTLVVRLVRGSVVRAGAVGPARVTVQLASLRVRGASGGDSVDPPRRGPRGHASPAHAEAAVPIPPHRHAHVFSPLARAGRHAAARSPAHRPLRTARAPLDERGAPADRPGQAAGRPRSGSAAGGPGA